MELDPESEILKTKLYKKQRKLIKEKGATTTSEKRIEKRF